ncbi:hypothetical protein ACOMHN_064065 [Nucella lapillus]
MKHTVGRPVVYDTGFASLRQSHRRRTAAAAAAFASEGDLPQAADCREFVSSRLLPSARVAVTSSNGRQLSLQQTGLGHACSAGRSLYDNG